MLMCHSENEAIETSLFATAQHMNVNQKSVVVAFFGIGLNRVDRTWAELFVLVENVQDHDVGDWRKV